MLVALIFLPAAPAARADLPDACSYLAGLLDDGSGPVFLTSFPTVEEGPLHQAAFLYDNAVAAIALIGCGQRDKAARIGDAILTALEHDRFWHDGRLRNGYLAGPVEDDPVKLAGWWDPTQNRWLEDRYQAGSDTGNLAWAMLALLALDETRASSAASTADPPAGGTTASAATGDTATGDGTTGGGAAGGGAAGDGATSARRYRDGAARIAAFLQQWQDKRGASGAEAGKDVHGNSGGNPGGNPGGFTGGTFGHEPKPDIVTWKSTEHNTDLAAAFARLATASDADDPAAARQWRADAAAAARFVTAMWQPACVCFATGTSEDGVTANRFLALDAQVWPVIALPRDLLPPAALPAKDNQGGVIATIEKRLMIGEGFAYSEALEGIWTEGTAQAALTADLLGLPDKAARWRRVVEYRRTADGSYEASSTAQLPTGFMLQTDPTKPRLYFRLPHLAAAAWAALAEKRVNPFAARH